MILYNTKRRIVDADTCKAVEEMWTSNKAENYIFIYFYLDSYSIYFCTWMKGNQYTGAVYYQDIERVNDWHFNKP